MNRRELLAGSAAASLLAMAGAKPARGASATASSTGPRTLLLVDDHDILYRAGTRRVLHPLKRHSANPPSIFTNSSPIRLDDEFRFYYGGYSGGATGSDDGFHVSGIGLATMPRDRFAGVRSIDRIGQITLKPIDLTGCCKGITINADASRGAVRVELLDDRGRRVRGFTRDDAEPMTGDGLRHAVRWKARSLSDLAPGRYMPRLHLENADVFAIALL